MVFEIPEPYQWDETFEVFYEKLDEEHKGLFKGIKDLSDSPACSETLEKLVKLIEDHFTDEEEMMKSKSYEDLDSHKKIHSDFVETLKGVKAPVSEENIKMAKEWLVNHIKGTDFKYKGKL
uniref:Myohemerythrin n=1 Tax=Theromyzon tessulatum TaxID=13286 RepID=HEMTM_THETS|nr:RecName: Full=Myohemerythrin; Short=MHr [Theromyzon tessulatum]AAG01808.1 myohemerythrin [Theromyzon tessulatum]